MIWLIPIGAALVGAYFYSANKKQSLGVTDVSSDSSTGSPLPPSDNQMGLPDIDPTQQGGNFDTSNDYAYIQGKDRTGVPFALLKAHAIRESNQNSQALRVEPSGKASYGLLQILWWQGSDRFKAYGYSADYIADGSVLYDPVTNVFLAGKLIMDNWEASGHNLRDTINMYNTGVSESERKAPGNYVNNVISNYNTLIKGQVL